MNEMIHTPGQEPEEVTRSAETKISAETSEHIYGDCDINRPWASVEDLDANVQGLPGEVQDYLFGSRREKVRVAVSSNDREGALRRGTDEDIERILRSMTVEGQVEDKVNAVAELNKDLIIDSMVINLMTVLEERLHLFKQWKQRLENGDQAGVAHDIKELMSGLWKKNQLPLSTSEVREIISGFREEIKRLNSEREQLEGRVSELRSRRSQAKQKHLQAKITSELKEQEDFVYGKWKQFRGYEGGYADDYKARINFNKKELQEAEKLLPEVMYIEQMMAKVKNRFDEDDLADIWLGLMNEVRYSGRHRLSMAPEVQEAAFDALTEWLDELEEIQPQDRETYRKKIELLTGRFRDAYEFIKKTKLPEDREASNVQHVQIILRRLLGYIEKQGSV